MGFKAQVVTEASASAAHFINGSLKVNDAGGADQFLTRTASSGNRKTYTWAGWVKRQQLVDKQTFMFAESDDSNQTSFGFNHSGATPASGFYFRTEISGTVVNATLDAQLQDTTNFYHIVVAVDTTRSYVAERIRVYINGKLQTWSINPGMGEDNETFINHNVQQQLFAQDGAPDLDALISNLYFLDGLALGPGYFGFTDPLTNTWRPKKFRAEGTTVNDGTQWSATIGDFTNGANVFNGNVTNQGYANNSGVTTLTTGKFVIKNNLRLLHNFREDGTYNLLINGVSINVPGNGTTSSTYRWAEVDISALQLPITVTSLKYYISQASGNSIRAIEVDGVIMQDSTTTNIDFGTNGFYLPFDGSSPVGEDKSGKGNDWTAIQLGSAALDKATGAFPILNTVNGGKVATTGTRTDANASDLVLALPLLADENDIHADIKGSGSNIGMTESGSVDFQINQSNFYGSSAKFDGSNDKLTSGTVSVSGADFTVEAWVYFLNADSANETVVEFTGTNRWIFGRKGTGNSSVMYIYDGSGERLTGTQVVDDVWHHMAWVKDGGVMHFYLDGAKIHSYDGSYGSNNSNRICVGRNNDNYEPIHGYLQDVRVYTTTKYTKNFIPAAASEPDIVPDTPSGVSGGSKLAKVTDGSVVGDGTTSDYLQVSSSGHSDFSMDGDFTVEWFYYRNSVGNGFMWTVGDSNTSTGLELYWGSSGSILKLYTNGGPNNLTGSGRVGWSHYAVVRSGSTITAYYNGTAAGSITNSNTFSGNFTIGGEYYDSGITGGLSGPISNFRYIKGTALYTSAFTPPTAPLTNVTNTKLLCCQSTTSATAAAVTPASITINGDAAATNFNPFNTDINAVRGQESGYPTLDINNRNSNVVLSNNNLTWTCDNSGAGTVLANMAVDAGKYYWEVTVNNGNRFHAGVHVGAGDTITIYDAGAILDNNWAFRTDGAKVHGGSESSTNFSNVSAIGNVIQLAYDADGGNLWFGANGYWFEGNPSTLSGPSYTGVTSTAGMSPFLNRRTNDNGATINFGQIPFRYVPPTGFSPINASSIRSATRPISNPEAYFNTFKYTGDGSSNRGITGLKLNAKPDFLWIRVRNEVNSHYLFDTVRGADKALFSDSNNDENDYSGSGDGRMNSFEVNGFTVSASASTGTNGNNDAYIVYAWKAGGDKGTFNRDGVGYASASAAGLSAGTITPTGASIGTKQGFSIITWTGTGSVGDIPHGLTQDPDVIMIKNRENDSSDWYVFGKFIDDTFDRRLTLNSTGNAVSSSSALNGTSAISSTIVKLGANEGTNGSTDDMLMYAWHSVPGLQKFGTYIGNGSSDGPVIKLGFRPALLIVKSMDVSEPWAMYDNARRGIPDFKNPNTFNANAKGLYANSDAVENDASGRYKDFTNDGFKVRGTSGEQNSANKQYFYMAWAEAPAFNLYGASAPAR